MANGTCAALAKPIAVPISRTSASANSPARSWSSARMRVSRAARSATDELEKAGKASRAAATARATSASPPAAIAPTTSSEAGSTTGSVRPVVEGRQAPPI